MEVRCIPDPERPEGRLVLCRSALRHEKELAMVSKAEARFLAAATALRTRIVKGQLKDSAKIERAIGRLLKSHPRFARFYRLHPEANDLMIQR